jgi:hypothetical protein
MGINYFLSLNLYIIYMIIYNILQVRLLIDSSYIEFLKKNILFLRKGWYFSRLFLTMLLHCRAHQIKTVIKLNIKPL